MIARLPFLLTHERISGQAKAWLYISEFGEKRDEDDNGGLISVDDQSLA
jgi:hypothetical protein